MFVGRQAVEGLESAREVVGGHASEGWRGAAKVGEVRAQLIVAVVMKAFDDGVLDVRFIRSTWPLVQGWFGLANRCWRRWSSQIMSKRI